MTVAVLALQGAFAEHENVLKRLGVDCIELRQAKDLETPYDGIILPGGESTVQGKLLKELGMFATCGGLILLASEVEGQEGCHFGTIPMCVRRNAYGRQLGSFHTVAELKGVGEVPMTFIRAPYVAETGDGVEVLATVDGKIVGVQYKNQMAFAFHPELDNDTRIHEKFAAMVRDK